ncbi:MAG: ABC transporter ATP-binding protein [Nitrososphaerales archaeon]
MANLLEISDLTVEYRVEGKRIVALDRVSLDMAENKGGLGVVGESGSGKTTLGLSILRLIEPPGLISRGSIEYDGKSVLGMSDKDLRQYRWEDVSMVYQSAMNSLNPVKDVLDPIVETLRIHKNIPKNDAREKAIELLSDVGIKPNRASSYPHELSGGMRQRVVIALALALSPKILIADEPTSALDVVTQRQILALLRKEIQQRGLTLIFITHEISLLYGLVDNVAVMFAGEIVERGSVNKVLSKPKHPYTEMLLSTLLTLQSTKGSLDQSRGSSKESINVDINACKYSARCKYVFDRCRKERPALKTIEDGREVACHKYN